MTEAFMAVHGSHVTFLPQLTSAISSLRPEASDVVDRETEILTLEQKATEALALTEPHGQGRRATGEGRRAGGSAACPVLNSARGTVLGPMDLQFSSGATMV